MLQKMFGEDGFLQKEEPNVIKRISKIPVKKVEKQITSRLSTSKIFVRSSKNEKYCTFLFPISFSRVEKLCYLISMKL